MSTLPEQAPESKVCTKCGETLPLTEFYRETPTRLQAHCKACHRILTERYRKANLDKYAALKREKYAQDPESYREQSVRYREAHPEECRARDKAHYEANRDQRLEQKRAYNAANADKRAAYRERKREERLAYNREYYQLHKEERQEAQRRYREEHPEKYAAIHKNWKQANPEAVRAMDHRRRARVAGSGGSFTAEEWKAIKAEHNHTCLLCGRQEPEITLTIDHIIPIAEGGTSDATNLQPLCKQCNSAKYRRPLDYRANPAEPVVPASVDEDTRQWLGQTRQPDFIAGLKTALKVMGMTQKDFAAQCGCSSSNISAIFTGKTSWNVPKYIWETAWRLGLLEMKES